VSRRGEEGGGRRQEEDLGRRGHRGEQRGFESLGEGREPILGEH
jgi:hypothetical protein